MATAWTSTRASSFATSRPTRRPASSPATSKACRTAAASSRAYAKPRPRSPRSSTRPAARPPGRVPPTGMRELMLGSDAHDVGSVTMGEEGLLGPRQAEDRLHPACNRLARIIEASPKPIAVVLGATEASNPRYRSLVDAVRDDFTK